MTKHRRKAAPKADKVPRLHKQDGRWYWKPEKRLRPEWKSAALGTDEHTARAEARRLNALAADWLKVEKPAVAPRRAQPRSVGELIALWRAGPMLDLAPRTRKQYDYELRRLEQEFGHEPAATLDTVRVDEWADTLRRKAPSTLRLVSSRGRTIFAWAGRKNFIPKGHNPFREMRIAGGGKRLIHVKWADVLHIITVAEELGLASLGHALATGFLTIQRITDVLALTEAHIQTEGRGADAVRSLRFAQSKTGFEVDQEWPDELAALLRLGRHKPATPAQAPKQRPPRGPLRDGHNGPAPLLVCERTGQRWDEKYASRLFAKVITAAIDKAPRQWSHLRGVQLRDGRRSGFVHGILGGANVELLCSMSGHTIEEGYQIVEHYLPKTRAAADKARAFMRVG